MNWTIEFTPDFSKGAKILSKRYKSFKDDLKDFKDSITKNPFQGAELFPGIRKIRMPIAAKGKGKSGGARVITLTFYVSEEDGTVKFLIIYDKSDADTVDVKVVRSIVKDLGFDLESLQQEGRLQEKEADNLTENNSLFYYFINLILLTMRKLKLLIAAAAILFGGLTANAQASYNTSWTEGVEVTTGYDYFLYNIGSGTFLTGGMDWGSSASGDHAGKTVEFRSAGEGVYKIWSYYYSPNGLSNDGWLGTNSYLDSGDGGLAECVFTPVSVNGYVNAYTIKNITSDKENTANKFLRYNAEDTRVRWADNGEDNYAYWLIIPKASRDEIGDYTYYIQNVGMNRFWERACWAGSTWSNTGFTTGGRAANPCGEKYHGAFDLNQVLSRDGLQAGRYRLYAQAFWRQDGTAAGPVLYLGDATQTLALFNGNGEGTADNMNGASDAFSAGQYVNSVEKFFSSAPEANSVRLGINITDGSQWVIWDNFYLQYLGQVVMDYAAALPDDGAMEANTWYFFDVTAAADNYEATATDLDKIICVTDGYTLTSAASGTVALKAEDNSLTPGRYYVKSSTANKLVVEVASFSYNVSTATADVTYIQPGQTVTVSYTVSTNDPDATLSKEFSGVTFNGTVPSDLNFAGDGFSFTVPNDVETNKEYTLNIPDGAIGYTYTGGSTFNAIQTITLKTPAVFDGTYFFKVENDGALKGQYLSRGKDYGTHASIDKYGLAIKVATDGDNKTTLKPFDTDRFYRMDNGDTNYWNCWADNTANDNNAKFNLVVNNGHISIHPCKNPDAEDFFKYDNADIAETTKIWADSHSGGNPGNVLEFSMESGAEHGVAMQALKDNQAAAAATAAAVTSDYASLSGITTVAALKTELTTNYIQGDFVAPTAISSVLEKYQGNQPGSGNTVETVYSSAIHIAEPGFYKFSMQAFYRASLNPRTQEMHTAGVDYNPVVLFFGDNQTQIKSLYDEAGGSTAYVSGNDAEYNGMYYANNMDAALKMFKEGKFHNDVWLYISTPGEYTYGVKYLGYANANGQWFIYSPESVTITSYAPVASAADYEALNAAIAENEGKTLGFEAGEYAPYNNAEAFAALAVAKAIDQTATNSKLIVESAIDDMNVWVANTEEVNAFADPTFAKSDNDGAQLGWKTDHSAGLGGSYHARAFVLESGAGNYDNLAAFGQGDGTHSAGYFRFDGTNSAKTTTYTYGETAGYTIPLKAYVYNLTAQIGGWGQVDKDVIVQVVNADGDVVGTQTVHTPNTGVNAGGSVVDLNLVFKAPVAGNYKVQLKNGVDADNAIVISNLDLRRPSNVYAIAGNNTDIFSDGWNITAEMDYLTLNEGVYTKTYADQTLDKQTIEFKVVKKERVESTSATAWYPANNVSISIPVKGKYDITITFDGNESTPTVTGIPTKTAEAVTISAAGWATTVTNSALDFSNSGVEAYTAKVEDNAVVLTKVTDVQAETGLVLKATEGTYYIPVIESSTRDKGSLLYRSTESYWTWHDNGGENNKFYGLALNGKGDAQFTQIACSAGNEVEIPGGKAFLLINSSSAARTLKVVFGDATGIDAVVAEKNVEGIYNMNGQRVTAPAKGLYIVNGKKVILK